MLKMKFTQTGVSVRKYKIRLPIFMIVEKSFVIFFVGWWNYYTSVLQQNKRLYLFQWKEVSGYYSEVPISAHSW